MAIHDYQQIMEPLLVALSDGHEHGTADVMDGLAAHFALDPDERSVLLPSGKQAVFANRVGWATTYLAKAKLIERTGRKRIRITKLGRDALRDQRDGTHITNAYLARFPEFVAFQPGPRRQSAAQENAAASDAAGDEEQHNTPDEALEASYLALRRTLAQDLLERIKQGSPAFFERLVIDLLVAMGYGGTHADAARAVGGSGDDGVDGIIKEDKLGLDFVYVQAKRWDGPVGRPTVQAFAGSLMGQRAGKGVLITTSKFT